MFILKEMDHSVGAVTALKVAEIPSDTILELTDTSPRIGRALWWNSLVEEAIAREWISVLGQREAMERLAHLFCELCLRLRGVGLTNSHSCELPVTQAELGDAIGLSTVHVNRTLQELRAESLLTWTRDLVVIQDWDRLCEAAQFNPDYLNLERTPR